MSISAMKQALEALEGLWDDGFGGVPESMHKDAITALRQAIAEAEKQQPVVGTKTWFEDGKVVTQHLHPSDIYEDPQPKQEPDKTEQGRIKSAIFGNNIEVMMDSGLSFLKALETTLKTYDHTTPVHASDISQERVDETAKYRHEFECPRCGHCCQQREWVGITEQDVHDAFQFTELIKQLSFDRERPEWCENFAAYLEAKLKEKNSE